MQVSLQGTKIAERTFRHHKPQFDQCVVRVVDEDEKRAGITPILEPLMRRPVDLGQCAKTLSAQTRLVERPTLFARQPDAIFLHLLADGLA